ncbi:Gfo/Idh/MocA family protein [Pengzhenrongella frigida]|uniref:Gfo/Idh/MocA family oxidoreductase n=1 Tax=Pengzhenrongella frigida TaxID=1259133 RepID=A0A4Q5N0Q2_9MICO|nr:Gfo/Idh/MocA family oxidoreductase [Cellulomonas sp. HLT2-17]RYV51606.1 Gfo/Idh/MocA family oxidoreductase [Cellulomonas sp. HLT2-17]
MTHSLDPGTANGIAQARFAIVGSGWRAEFFARLARLMPERFAVTAVVSRGEERRADVARAWGVPTAPTIAAAFELELPDFVVVAVPWAVSPGVIRELVAWDVPVLAETPPAPDLAGLRALWADVGQSGLVQVAEHSPFMPAHAARLAALRLGLVGEVTSVQISSTHQYHAVAVIRAMLGVGVGVGGDAGAGSSGVGFGVVDVSARTFTAPLVDPITRAGWTSDDTARDATTTIATLDFGDGRSGLYDFTDNQWHNPLRTNRIVVRGSRGELVDDRIVRLTGDRTVVESHLVRRQAGIEQNLDGFDLDHLSVDGQVLYRNVFQGARLADDDLAVAALLAGTAAWVAGGPAPYPLAQGCQDHLLGLAIGTAARTGVSVRTHVEAWAH